MDCIEVLRWLGVGVLIVSGLPADSLWLEEYRTLLVSAEARPCLWEDSAAWVLDWMLGPEGPPPWASTDAPDEPELWI